MPPGFYNGPSTAKPAISWWVSGRAICLVMTTYGVLSLAGGLQPAVYNCPVSLCVCHIILQFFHTYTSCSDRQRTIDTGDFECFSATITQTSDSLYVL